MLFCSQKTVFRPIGTSFNKILSATISVLRESFVGRKFAVIVKNGHFQFFSVIAAALLALVFKGSNAEGQVNFFSSALTSYVEETSLSIAKLRRFQDQSAEISSFVGTNAVNVPAAGRGGPENPETTVDLSTVQDNSVQAYNPTARDYIDAVGAKRSQVLDYTVQDGDLISFIASDYGVSVNSILWANNLKDADTISPGQVLRIPPVSGVIHGVKKGDTVENIAKKYGVQPETIIAFNELPQDGRLQLEDEVVVPGGRIQGYSAIGDRGLSTYVQTGPSRVAQKFGYLPDLTGYFMAPAVGYNWGILHGRNGIDIANSCGTPIYAAAEGVVQTAKESGWNGGFGKYLKISHQNGTETLYSHNSKLMVSIGQSVVRGQLIALMGSTGRSTGCHLHFEVHGARNPLAKY